MIHNLVTELNLDNRVVFLGQIERSQVAGVLQNGDVFIMPGDGESLSIATLEAMACGLPVIAANSMALPELVNNGKNGLLFQPGNADDLAKKMDEMANLSGEWNRMGISSKTMAKNHQLSSTIDRYEALYVQMLHHKPQPDIKHTKMEVFRPFSKLMLNSNAMFFILQFGIIMTILLLTLLSQNSPVIASPGNKIDLISDDMLVGIQKLFTIIKQIDLPNQQINGGMSYLNVLKQGFG
jgi:hypothetical protein